MNKGFITIVGAAALVASTAGFAGGPDLGAANHNLNNAAGFYISGNVGYGHNSYDTNSLVSILHYFGISSSVDHNSFAWAANVGYQFNPYVAVEAGYMGLPRLKLTTSEGNTFRSKLRAVTMDVKGIYPVSQQIDLFAKAGLALEWQKETVNGGDIVAINNNKHPIVPLFGLGAAYNITQNVAVSVQGITTLKHNANFPATYTGLVGLTYKFS